MAQIYVKYNPYRLETELKVNGQPLPVDSGLYILTRGKRLQEWIGNFPKMLKEARNARDWDLEFQGMALDWDDFRSAFRQAEEENIIKIGREDFIESARTENVTQKIIQVFYDLRNENAPISAFRDSKITQAFRNVQNAVFPVNVIATMSAGKSTLINALLGKQLMPAQAQACTAVITQIRDNDQEGYSAKVFYKNEKQENEEQVREIPELTLQTMNELNEDQNVRRISITGNIPFLDAREIALELVDTPGPNNSQNREHRSTTYRAVNRESDGLILYVLNATQLAIDNDAELLEYMAEQMREGSKTVRDRFLFVLNKMDAVPPNEVEGLITAAKEYLVGKGIRDPQIFPCSAVAALHIRTTFAGETVNSENYGNAMMELEERFPGVNPKFCVKSIVGENRAIFICGGRRGIRLLPFQ